MVELLFFDDLLKNMDVVGLDKILSDIGCFGKRQVCSFILIFSIAIFNCACHYAYVFTAMEAENRCFIPGCDDDKAIFMADHINFTIPSQTYGKIRKCQRYIFKNNLQNSSICSSDLFDHEITEPCDNFVFRYKENSIAKEFNLLCEEDVWKLSSVGTSNTFGVLLGLWISGYLSDRYGRREVLIFGMTSSGLVGLSKSFSPSLFIFCLLEFFEAFLQSGCHGILFILAIELVNPEKRLWIGCIFLTTCAFGQMILAVVAWSVKDWRNIIYIFYAPCIFMIFLRPLILESIRWQLGKGDIKSARATLNKLAKSNGKIIPSSDFYTMQKDIIAEKENSKKITLAQVIKSKILFFRLIILAGMWIASTLLFYGLSLSSVSSLSGNDYLNYFLISIIELPIVFLMPVLSVRIRRKILLIGSYSISLISSLTFIFFRGPGWLPLVLHCLGKFGAAFAFNILYIISSEMFPTLLRNSTMAVCSTIGRIGCMISPQVAVMGVIWIPLPNVIFAIAAGIAAVLAVFLPETMGVKLPDTIEEAEDIGRKKVPAERELRPLNLANVE